MNSLTMIIKYWMKSKKDFVISFVFQFISTIFTILIPIYIGNLVGSIDLTLSYEENVLNMLFLFLMIVIFSILAFLFSRFGRIKGAEVSTRAVYELRNDISKAIYKQSFSYFDKLETGQLISRATSDVEQTQMILGFGLVHGILAIIQLGMVIVSTLILQFYLGLIFLATIPITLILLYLITKKLKPIYLEVRNSFGDLTNTIRENIVGSEVVRIFSMQEKENSKFSKDNKRFLNANIRSIKFNTVFMTLNILVIAILTISVLFIGGNLILQNSMTIDMLITFLSYVGLIGFPLTMFGQIFLFYIQADAALTRIRDVLESTPEVKDYPDAIPIEESLTADIEFDDVSFGYTPQNKVLKNISFKLPAGKKLAILGTTGSGKSTIINLLPRFYDITEGSIKIDNRDIKKYLLKDLRKNIGIVSQDSYLFNKSVRDNIAFGNDSAELDDIIEAAKVADLHDFIQTLPKRYDTIIGERGTRLSGGQKQRLSIARALIINPKILIFDDSTSSVDVETEYNIQQALEKIMKNTTTIIITQRISTIRDADLILVLDKGRVVGFGKHSELIEDNVLYKQIYQTLYYKQKSEEYEEN